MTLLKYWHIFICFLVLAAAGCSDTPSKPSKGLEKKETDKGNERASKLDNNDEEASGRKKWEKNEREEEEEELEEEEEEPEEEKEEPEEEEELTTTKKVLTNQFEDSCFKEKSNQIQKVCGGQIILEGGLSLTLDLNILHLKECNLMYGEFKSQSNAIDMEIEIVGYEESKIRQETTSLVTKALFGQSQITVKGRIYSSGTLIDEVNCTHTIK